MANTAGCILAMAYMSQYIPGSQSDENKKFAQSALDQFNKVLADDPKDSTATSAIASIYFNQNDFDKAEEWNRKLIAIKPDSKEAYYTLGVIAWTKWVKEDLTARAEHEDEAGRSGSALKDKKDPRPAKGEMDAGVGCRCSGHAEGARHRSDLRRCDGLYEPADYATARICSIRLRNGNSKATSPTTG